MPFTVLVALPISMITIPIALTFFPDMLPSAFAEEKTEIKTRRRIHEEQMVMSRMLQSEIERTAAANDMHADGEQLCLHNFLDMMRQARTTGKSPSLKCCFSAPTFLRWTLFCRQVSASGRDREICETV